MAIKSTVAYDDANNDGVVNDGKNDFDYLKYKTLIESYVDSAVTAWGNKIRAADSGADKIVTINALVKFERSQTKDKTTGLIVDKFNLASAGALDFVETRKIDSGASYGLTNVAYEVLTGVDANGNTNDMVVVFNTLTIDSYDWTGSLDPSKYDLRTALLHEVGHAFGFSGRLHKDSINSPSSEVLTYDQNVGVDKSGNLVFNGVNATRVNLDSVMLDQDSYSHLNDQNDLMSSSLAPGGVESISDLDVAMLSDMGLSTDYGDTIYGAYGARYNDNINGGAGNDTIYGSAGNDTVNGGYGHDEIYGGKDNDSLCGNEGHDQIQGGMGKDTIFGGYGNDVLHGNDGYDLIYGDVGNDSIYGGTGSDTLYGGQGKDYMAGGADIDYFLGGLGEDTLSGGLGGDYFLFDKSYGNDLIVDFNGNSGDRVVLAKGIRYTIGSSSNGSVYISTSDSVNITIDGVSVKSFQSSWIISA